MKKITLSLFLPIVLCFAVVNCKSQTTKGKKDTKPRELSLEMISAYYGDSVILRWAPSSWPIWIAGVDGGYVVERYDVDLPADYLTQKDLRKKKAPVLNLKSKKVLTNIPLKPISEQEWKKIFDTGDTLSAMAAHLVYGKRKDVVPSANVNPQDLLNAYDEQHNLHTLVLLTADRSATMAKGMGLSFTDKTIEKNKGYFYRVYIYNENKTLKYDSAGTFVNTFKVDPIPVIPRMSALEGEHSITLMWDQKQSSISFTSYIIERSADNGKTFITLTKPVFIPSVDTKDDKISWKDNLPENYKYYLYRVTGITPFGLKGKPNTMQCMGRDRTPPLPPDKITAEHISGNSVKITWEKKQKEGDLSGYFIGKGHNDKGPFTPISNKKLAVNATTFTDDSASTHELNYYVVAVIDTSGNTKASHSAYAVMKDDTPPAKPVNLIAKMDTTGAVQLTWKFGKEPDIEGYLVYFANDSSHVFTPISRDVVPINAFRDTTTLNTLTKFIYYKVAAMDTHKNLSALSDFARAKRPDTIAPVQPVFTDFKVADTSITIFWNRSTSTDVIVQDLYRKEGEKDWVLYKHLDKNINAYKDAFVVARTEYQYALCAIDDAGNSSSRSYPIKGRAYGKSLVVNETPRLTFVENEHKIDVIWTKNTYDGQMIIYRNYNSKGMMLYKNTDARKGVFSDMNLNGPGTYEYAIKIQLQDGSVSKLSSVATLIIK